MKLLARLVAVLLTGIIAWLGMAQPGTASPLPTLPSTVYGYDSQVDTTPLTSSAVEHGPPRAYDYTTTYGTVGLRPHGASERPDRAAPRAALACDHTVVQIARTSSTTEGQARVLDSDPASVAGASVAANGGSGLFRKTSNVGAFAGLPERMSLRNVKGVAREAGIGLQGVKVKIVRDPDLVGSGLMGHTLDSRTIHLYPDAFSSRTALRQTLGHERTHIYQYRTFGTPSPADVTEFERAAYGLDYQW